MAKTHKPDPDHLFNILKLNKWFAISSVLLLLGILAMIKKDYDREWKHWQRKFRAIEIQQTKEQIARTTEELKGKPEYLEAKGKLDEATAAYKKNEIEIFNLNKELSKKDRVRFKADRIFRDLKSELDALRYELDEQGHHNDKAANKTRSVFNKKTAKLEAARVAKEAADRDYEAVLGKIRDLETAKNQAESDLNKVTADLQRLERKESQIRRSFVNDVLRDAPMLDFINPSLRVKELIVDDLYDDYNFAKIRRIDACTTCHVAIDKPGYEEQPNPLKTHPRLDLYLSSTSPHKIGDFGCTVCHGGMGGSLTFAHAGHTPKNEEQAKEWEKKYHWHPLKHWDDPMLALQYTEANCLGCHKKEIDVPGASKMNQAIFLVERSGCPQCHKIDGWHLTKKPGPDLTRVTSKVTPEWIAKWVRNPKSFRPTTAMPKFFDLTNTSDYASKARSTVQVAGIVAYLQNKAKPYQPATGRASGGNAEAGKQTFGKVGCLGCHTMDDYPNTKQPQFGPDLSDVGSKLSADWLAAWLKNPKEYWPESRMPNMRLTDAEIRNLTAYLMTKKNASFEEQKTPKPDSRTIHSTAYEFLKDRMPLEEAKAKAAAMSEEEKLLMIGERTISHYGCYSCHNIEGFENAKPIGAELTLEASKPLSRFDFGFVDIEKSIPAWVRQKLLEPRVYDKGKEKTYFEKLRMPQFDFTPEEAELITTYVMGLKKYDIPSHRLPSYGENVERIRQGRTLVHEHNCRGCHIVEKIGGNILAQYESPRMGPPNLQGIGAKLQPEWFYHFLKNPSTVRPWLQVRMPTFGFDDAETNALINYFRALDRESNTYETLPALARSGAHFELGRSTFGQYQCQNCHRIPPYASDTDFESLAPPLTLAPRRLRYEWLDDWLRDPQKLLPGTGMPGFFYYEGQPLTPESEDQVQAVRDYLFVR